MQRLLVVAVLAMAVAASAAAQDKRPVNAKCPVKGEAAKPDITAEYEGKVIGFC
jgi:hypothetical protein